ncbi:LysE/ArgO family amino acid transporter [Aeromicrobium sp.]|uniref:LysE/ArgO family amino acid transporter n=1 Tax=Aeromicrobium sp. TaxID=1871063 RepID=UPI0030C4EB8A
MDHAALVAALGGIGFGLSLIIAIGAQNAFVLRQGLRAEHVLAVVAICAISDVILIGLGIAGIGGLLELAPWLIDGMRIGGAIFLLAYAVIAARRALRPGAIDPEISGAAASLWSTVATAMALTWLNPHVYLDTILLLGSVAGSYGDERWWFGLGAALGSVIWFAALGFGARFLRPLFARPMAWRILDAVIAVIMVAIALSLLHGLMEG